MQNSRGNSMADRFNRRLSVRSKSKYQTFVSYKNEQKQQTLRFKVQKGEDEDRMRYINQINRNTTRTRSVLRERKAKNQNLMKQSNQLIFGKQVEGVYLTNLPPANFQGTLRADCLWNDVRLMSDKNRKIVFNSRVVVMQEDYLQRLQNKLKVESSAYENYLRGFQNFRRQQLGPRYRTKVEQKVSSIVDPLARLQTTGLLVRTLK